MSTLTIALAGATGRTGLHVLQRALDGPVPPPLDRLPGFGPVAPPDAGPSPEGPGALRVRALVRDPAKLDALPEALRRHPRLTVVRGDVLDPGTVDRLVDGADVVLSVFGQVKGSAPDVQTRGTAHLLEAMARRDVPRIVSLSGGGLPEPAHDRPGLVDRLIRGAMRLAVPRVLEDAEAHVRVLRASGTGWVVARAPRLTQAPATGAARLGWVGVNAGRSLPRADLADVLLRLAYDARLDGRMPFVTV